MADRKSRKKRKKQNNKSSRQKKITNNKSLLPQQDERPSRKTNSIPHTDNNRRLDQEHSGRSSSRGRISTCLQRAVSRIAGTFGRGTMTRERGLVASSCNDGQRHLNDVSLPSGESSPVRRATEIIKHDEAATGKLATIHQKDLYDALQDLCKPKAYYNNDLPKMNISFSIEFHTGITTVLVEMYNNIPDLNDMKSKNEDIFFQSELLRKLIMRGAFALCYFKLVSKKNRRGVVLAFMDQAKRRDTLLSNGSESKKMKLFYAKNAGSILQKPRSKGNFANVKQNPKKASLLYKIHKTMPKGEMLLTSNFMKRVNISGSVYPCLWSNVIRDTAGATQSDLTISILPLQSPTQSLSMRDPGLQVLFNQRKTTKLDLGSASKLEPKSTSKEIVHILFKFESTKQSISVHINAFMSILEIFQKELMVMSKGIFTKAIKFQKYSARPTSETDKSHVKITIKIPGLAPLQVLMVPISLVQHILQKYSNKSLIPLLNKDRTAQSRLKESIGRAIQFSTETYPDRNLAIVRPTIQKQRHTLIPEEAILAVVERFLPVNNVTCRPNLTLYLKFDDTEKTKSKERKIEDDNSRENIKHGTPDTEDMNDKKEVDADEYDSALYEFFGESGKLNENEHTDRVYFDDEIAGLGDLELKYDSTQYEFFGGAGEPEISDGMWLGCESTGLDESGFEHDSTQYDFFGDSAEDDCITDGASLVKVSPGLVNLGSVDAHYSSTQYDFFGGAFDAEDITDGEQLSDEVGDLGELEPDTDKPPNAEIPCTESERNWTGVSTAGVTPTEEFRNFDSSVPQHLGQIEVPFKDKADLVFEVDEEGEKVLLSSGGFGDVYLARMANTSEPVIVKKTRNMKFVGILKETRIQTYLMRGQYVPAIEGIIGGPGHSETMIIQQFCASGRTLYDVIQACHAETLTLFESHWLKLAYKLAVCFDDMHGRGVLHNDIKTDNILVELTTDDISPYIIDYGMASFRKGGRLTAPSGCSDCSSYDDYLAPEVRKCQSSSPKSDIYSLGKVLYEMAYYFCDDLGPLSVDMCSDVAEDRPSLKDVADFIENIIVEKNTS